MRINWKIALIYLGSAAISCTIITALVIICKGCFSPTTTTETPDNTWEYAFFDPDRIIDYNSAESSIGGVYWVVYDDPDAEWFSQVMSMDKETYEVILSIIKAKNENIKCTIIDTYEPCILYKEHHQPMIVLKEY